MAMLAQKQDRPFGDTPSAPVRARAEIRLPDHAFLDPQGRHTLVADNDDFREEPVTGPVELSGDAAARPLLDTPRQAGPARQPWVRALAVSLALHLAAAAFFIAGEEGVLIAGGAEAEVAAIGDAELDAVSAGDAVEIEIVPVPMVAAAAVEATRAEAVSEALPVAEAVPEVAPAEVAPAEAVETERVEAAAEAVPEAAPAETVEAPSAAAVEAEPAPAQEAERAPAAEPEVEILAVAPVDPEPQDAVAETPRSVEAETVPAAEAEPVRTATAEAVPERPVEERPEEALAEQTIAEAADIPVPTRRPASLPPPAPRQAAERQQQRQPPPPAAARNAGSGGQSQADARRGSAEGRADGRATARNAGGSRNAAAGNAAVSNYPGQVASRLRRALRYPPEARRQGLRGEAQVQFTVDRGGGVSGVRVVRSSGSPVLDNAALEAVRRAAPFPPIPDGAGRSSWPFTVPLAFTR